MVVRLKKECKIMSFINRLADWMEDVEWDRTTTQDGQTFYGQDDDDGYTTWYMEDGTCDSRTPTPDDDDEWDD
jgi:hypothetical protein